MKRSFWSRLWQYFNAFCGWLILTLLATPLYIGIGHFCLNLQAGLPLYASATLLGAATGWWIRRWSLRHLASAEQEEATAEGADDAAESSKYFWLKFVLWFILIPVIYAFIRCGANYVQTAQTFTWTAMADAVLHAVKFMLVILIAMFLTLAGGCWWQQKGAAHNSRTFWLSLLLAVCTQVCLGTLTW